MGVTLTSGSGGFVGVLLLWLLAAASGKASWVGLVSTSSGFA